MVVTVAVRCQCDQRASLIHDSDETKLVWWIEMDTHFHVMSWQIGYAAVQGQGVSFTWPFASVMISSPGGPFEDTPQRHSHSSNPVSHPSPPRSARATNLG